MKSALIEANNTANKEQIKELQNGLSDKTDKWYNISDELAEKLMLFTKWLPNLQKAIKESIIVQTKNVVSEEEMSITTPKKRNKKA